MGDGVGGVGGVGGVDDGVGVPDGSVRPDRFVDVDLEVFAGFRAYYKGFSVDARSGEAVISFAVPVRDKYEALRITDRPGLVGFVQFWAKRQK